MKNILILLMGVLMLTPLFGQSSKSIGKVSFPIGQNHIQSEGSVDWNKVRYFMPVHDRDKVKTGDKSRCEITFSNKKVMRIGANSMVELTRDEHGTEEVKMPRGLAWLSIFLPKGKTKLRVRTPSSVCAIRGTVYRLSCDNVHTTYRCYEGTIKVTPFKDDGATLADSSFSINSGEELIVVMDFEEYKKMQQKEIQDFKQQDLEEFEKFKEQDQTEFDEMVESDLKDFKNMDNISYKRTTFDQEEDASSDWVKWNRERDNLIKD